MSEEELKPCPFCGSKVTVQVIPPHTHKLTKWIPDCNGEAIIECKCGCSIMRDTEEEAITHWNTRKTIEKIVEQLEEWTFNADVNLGDGTVKNSDLIASKNAIDIVKRGGAND